MLSFSKICVDSSELSSKGRPSMAEDSLCKSNSPSMSSPARNQHTHTYTTHTHFDVNIKPLSIFSGFQLRPQCKVYMFIKALGLGNDNPYAAYC